jgi:acyl dehydratase
MESIKNGKYKFSDFKVNKQFDLGETSLSEKQIIDFALAFDPLDIHIDKKEAEKGFFHSLVASGPHLFNVVHKNKWIPAFKDTVICGLEVNKWRFSKPVYPGESIGCIVTILSIKENPERKHASVVWLYEFRDKSGELVQSLEMTVLHKTDS